MTMLQAAYWVAMSAHWALVVIRWSWNSWVSFKNPGEKSESPSH